MPFFAILQLSRPHMIILSDISSTMGVTPSKPYRVKPLAVVIRLPSTQLQEFEIQVDSSHKARAPLMAAGAKLLRDLLRDEVFRETIVPAIFKHYDLTAVPRGAAGFVAQMRAVTLVVLMRARKWPSSYGYATVNSANTTVPSVSVVWSNAEKWDNKTDEVAHRDIACHLFHEMAHTLGYFHSDVVPYAAQHSIEEVATGIPDRRPADLKTLINQVVGRVYRTAAAIAAPTLPSVPLTALTEPAHNDCT